MHGRSPLRFFRLLKVPTPHGNQTRREYWKRSKVIIGREIANMDTENKDQVIADSVHEGRDVYDMDVDRMINEGLGGGQVTLQNGLISETTTGTMEEDTP
jgi:hypothetical protein